MTETVETQEPVADTAGHAPVWSAHLYQEEDREAVLAMFTEPRFYFRTAQPDTRPEAEVLRLVTEDDTFVLCADGRPAGLYALEETGASHYCHYFFHLRLHEAAPRAWWQAAYREVTDALAQQRELVRLTVVVGEYDQDGLAAVRQAAFTEEGTLAGVVVHDGRRYGQVFFSRVWEPE